MYSFSHVVATVTVLEIVSLEKVELRQLSFHVVDYVQENKDPLRREVASLYNPMDPLGFIFKGVEYIRKP